MRLTAVKMNEKFAKEIVSWRYPAPYDLYNMDENDIAELMNDDYGAIVDETLTLVGFYCTGSSAQVPAGRHVGGYGEEFTDIGLGLRPNLTGIGNGYTFLRYILSIIGDEPLRLTVATFNQRGIKLYEKFGFTRGIEFSNGKTEFVVMSVINKIKRR